MWYGIFTFVFGLYNLYLCVYDENRNIYMNMRRIDNSTQWSIGIPHLIYMIVWTPYYRKYLYTYIINNIFVHIYTRILCPQHFAKILSKHIVAYTMNEYYYIMLCAFIRREYCEYVCVCWRYEKGIRLIGLIRNYSNGLEMCCACWSKDAYRMYVVLLWSFQYTYMFIW